jgi:hypothetical protein
MAKGLLEHAVKFGLNNWLGASNDAMLPPENTPVQVEPTRSGYKLEFKVQTFDVEMMFAHDMGLQRKLQRDLPPLAGTQASVPARGVSHDLLQTWRGWRC